MNKTSKKYFKKNGKIYTGSGRVYTEESFKRNREYSVYYMKNNYRVFVIKCRKDNDDVLIQWMESKDNLTNYVKELIIKNMKEDSRNNKENQ